LFVKGAASGWHREADREVLWALGGIERAEKQLDG